MRAGLTWSSVDLDRALLHVVQVAEEAHGGVVIRPYPKTRAGVRTVPLPASAARTAHPERFGTTRPLPKILDLPEQVWINKPEPQRQAA